ncbi:helix-turn-helix domain-containing protein [Thermus neutrinimicus]|uniref:helix-turn-helix domain-containing protein n=1 Tax=Thermus neutrinimicus TaxID=2908149 RepID=UPI001FAA8539|nr:helix-turn-helix domain-containing protein [Thermus neutrinimicus]
MPKKRKEQREVKPIALKPEEFAQAMGVAPLTVYNWIRAGLIPHVRINKRIYIHYNAVEELLNGRSS